VATAEAMRKAMEFAQQCCFTQVEMEPDSALFFIIHFTTVPQSTERWTSVHCRFTVTSVRRTNKKILKSNNVITENNPGTTYIPTKPIWIEARDIIIFTSSIKSNCIFTTRGRTPLWLDKTKEVKK
jgi:hypothetical protein